MISCGAGVTGVGEDLARRGSGGFASAVSHRLGAPQRYFTHLPFRQPELQFVRWRKRCVRTRTIRVAQK